MANRPPNFNKLIEKKVRDVAFNRPPKAVNSTRLPDGSGFDKLIRRRADTNNLPGATNHFGDRITGPAQKNTQAGNPRLGKTFRTGMTSEGRTIHLYGSGKNVQKVVLPKRKATFKYY